MLPVAHLSASLSRRAGGIFEIELALARELDALGVPVHAHGLWDNDWNKDAILWRPLRASVYRTTGPTAFGYAHGMLDGVVADNASLAHLHTLWMHPSVVIHRWARRTGNPYLVTPNGMLEPWALRNSAWKKKLAGLLYENRMLRGAACFQANSEKELRDIRAYGLKNPVCIIPNGVDLVDAETLKTETLISERKILLFLGRLHPKKGLVNALRAWGEVKSQRSKVNGRDEWHFVIAGWDQGGHEAELMSLCDELGLAYSELSAASFTDKRLATTDNGASVIFVGPAFGEQKEQLLRRASAFILPSFSEGLPMSVLEAWAYNIPVLMTEHCNIPEGFTADAAIRIGTDMESIANGMSELLQLSISDLRSLGRNGRVLVERQFTWPMVACQMKEVYEWVLGGGTPPSCVVNS